MLLISVDVSSHNYYFFLGSFIIIIVIIITICCPSGEIKIYISLSFADNAQPLQSLVSHSGANARTHRPLNVLSSDWL